MTSEHDAGVLLVDKPAGKTSFDMVRAVRRVFGIKKVGHAGTLDPFATGLLVICIGRPATRLIEGFMGGEKEYLATMRLGQVSTTLDPEGEVSYGGSPAGIDETEIESALTGFRGEIWQKPPQYSALKHKGKPLYHYARKGITIEKEPRKITIHQLDWLDRRISITDEKPSIDLLVRCSKGTYIRSLAADIGATLGCGAYLTSLRRTKSGFFSVEHSVPGTDFYDDHKADLIRNNILAVGDVQKLLQSS